MYPRNLFGARLKIVLKTKVPYIKKQIGHMQFRLQLADFFVHTQKLVFSS